MSSIIHITNKASGITYAYESHSYWDKDAKAPRTRRIYLGRVDENGNIIPKKDKPVKNCDSTNSDSDTTDYKKLYEQLLSQNSILTEKIERLESSLSDCRKLLLRLSKLHNSEKGCIDEVMVLFERNKS